MFGILVYVYTSNTTRRTLPPVQLSKEYFTPIVAINNLSAVNSSGKWDWDGYHVELHIEFSRKVFAIKPYSEKCRNIFFSIKVNCQDINRINGVQSYFQSLLQGSLRIIQFSASSVLLLSVLYAAWYVVHIVMYIIRHRKSYGYDTNLHLTLLGRTL